MNRHLFTVAALLGALAILWAGIGFIDTSLLALAMTALIGAVYAYGAIELHRFRQATATLAAALSAIPENLADLGEWLAGIHPSLQTPVRLRIEGERTGLPGPALTPYLVGLLVMLGMLGTFLGMVVTLKGAVFALERTTDLEAIRSALAVPVKGLGLAFGTSVAGVAASAMLGLMSSLSRRERMHVSQSLDTRIATTLRRFSLTHQRQETFKALQMQSQALPELVDRLQAMMAAMEDTSRQLSERLLGNQDQFHDHVKSVYTDLAHAVARSLRDSLSQGAQAAGESIRPVVETAMNTIARDARQMQERMADSVQSQLQALSARLGEDYAALQAAQAENDRQRQQAWAQSLDAMTANLAREWQDTSARTLSQQQQLADAFARDTRAIADQARAGIDSALAETTRLIAGAEELVRTRIDSETQWMEQHRERTDQLAGLLRTELAALRDAEAARAQAAIDRLQELQAAVATHLTTLGTALEQPIARLIETASEAPRAAAEVIGQLRQEISRSVERDNTLLEERSRIMETLNALLEAINHASLEQRAVIDSLVASAAAAMNATAGAFSEQVSAETARLGDIAAGVTGSAVEVASLSEAFGAAVQSFGEASGKLIDNLQRIEGAMDKSMSRSDEQLAYYVAQARDVIDLSMASQKEIVEELRRITARQAMMADEVR
jgi:hypothetical protein